MKRLSWLILLTLLITIPFVSLAPTTVQATNINISALDDNSAAHLKTFSGDYIGNAHSRIFHYADCYYVGRMADRNKVYFDTRDEAIDSGYRPCKVCKP